MAAYGLCRVEAAVLAWNSASTRVLENAGYEREGVLWRSVYDDGQVLDSQLYARVTNLGWTPAWETPR
jgi:ribosomal-protein-alanine N-acetyltransferase